MTATETAAQRLIRLLQTAYSAELAAFIAYHGHERSVRDPVEKAEIRRIGRQELHHRRVVRDILAALGGAPSRALDRKMTCIGRAIWVICFATGWFVPMWGAGRLERNNIGEYEEAARLALAAGRPEFVDACLEMAEVEWDHEAYFHRKARSHALSRVFPDWPDPPPRSASRTAIRAAFESAAEPVGAA